MRRQYSMTENQFTELLEACKYVQYLVIGGVEPRTPQQNANAFWVSLGKELGFDPMTVKSILGKDKRFFTAEEVPPPPDEKVMEESLADFRAGRRACGLTTIAEEVSLAPDEKVITDDFPMPITGNQSNKRQQ